MTSMIGNAVQSVKDKTSEMLSGKDKSESKSSTEYETKQQQGKTPSTIKAVVIEGPKKISIASRPYPSFHVPNKGEMQHGVIIRLIAAGICGSDLHAYTGRAAAKPGMSLGHENVGEVMECGTQVRHIKTGDIVLLPFNISCGTCTHCKESLTQACDSKLNNVLQTGGIYGYPMAGDWEGGQAEYLFVPWADFNCFQLDSSAIKGKLASITLMTDVLPTALHAVTNAEVDVGKTVYIAGAGPIGLACAHFAFLKGAACVIMGDLNATRLKQAQEMGCFTVDCGKISVENLNKEVATFLHGSKYVDCAIDAVGYESAAQGHGHVHEKHIQSDRTAAINSCIQCLKTGGNLSIPGVYIPGDPQQAKEGPFQLDMANVFMKGLIIKTGQTPVAQYLPYLYRSIMYGRTDVTKFLNIRVIPLEQAPKAYEQFHKGENVKYIIDANGLFERYNGNSLAPGSGVSLDTLGPKSTQKETTMTEKVTEKITEKAKTMGIM